MILSAGVAFVLGLFAWSFAEYALHNWWGHVAKGRNDFSREHLAHHRDTTYFAPNHKKIAAATVTIGSIGVVAVWVAGWLAGLVFTGAFLFAWVAYEILHRRIHTHAPKNAFARWARRHHLAHHFNGIKGNFGVTSPLWDILLRTHVDPGVVRVPGRQMAGVSWLFDDSGTVKGSYADDYALGKRAVSRG